ncbi:MAG: hypothetical protein IIZ94_11935 [Prevotella sp.]|nr:hypothetical protein [Prevotella sp.]
MADQRFVMSADVISEELRDYMIHRNLSMHVAYIDEREVLILRVIQTIERHIDMVCKTEGKDLTMADILPVANKLYPMFNGSLDAYDPLEAIKFDNIIELVHAIFQGNWGIEVKLIPSKADPETWKPECVGFIKDDPIK